MEQARDFAEESAALDAALARLGPQDWERPTQFKGWTANDVLVHLHFWNRAADLSLRDPDAFRAFLGEVMGALGAGGLRAFENAAIAARGPALAQEWRALWRDMGERWATLDPKRRVKWAGPDMSVRSAITARQMETWAHGQEIFDLLGLEREETDRVKNIVVLGVNTYGWTWKARGREAPGPMPRLRLTAPSGAIWEFGEAGGDSIEGAAVDFARVVTQTRNVADTGLVVRGAAAREWMANAQCFAGPPEDPPAPGTRFRAG